MITDNFCFYLQDRPIQTSQTGGQWYSDTFPFSIPWLRHQILESNLSVSLRLLDEVPGTDLQSILSNFFFFVTDAAKK
jgi:hypothetical protein